MLQTVLVLTTMVRLQLSGRLSMRAPVSHLVHGLVQTLHTFAQYQFSQLLLLMLLHYAVLCTGYDWSYLSVTGEGGRA